MANKPLKSIKFPGLNDTYTVPEVDDTLAVTGAAADAKKVGDEISDLKADLNESLIRITFEDGNLIFIKSEGSEEDIMNIDVSKLIIASLNDNSPYYANIHGKRLAYPYFDLVFKPGIYTIHWDSTIDLNVGIVIYNETAKNKIENNQTLSTNDYLVLGWYSNDYTFEIPEKINGYDVEYIRVNWKSNPENVFSSTSVISKVILTKEEGTANG